MTLEAPSGGVAPRRELPSRGRAFVLRYVVGRRHVFSTTPGDELREGLLLQLAQSTLDGFAEWVTVIEPAAGTSFARCALEHDHGPSSCGQPWKDNVDFAALVEGAMDREGSLAWGTPGTTPHGVIMRLVVEDDATGVVAFGRAAQTASWDEDDLRAIDDVVTALGVDLERERLRYQTRDALRSSQRVASQLHQLISASLAVGVLNDTGGIILALARSARGVFEADRAIVVLNGEEERLVASAQRGRRPRLLDAAASRETGVPEARDDANEPWSDGEWLCAPVLDSQRRSRGVIAARRGVIKPFSDEDRELAMLLGQLAATSLEALALNRTIQDNETRLRILVDAAPIGIVQSDDAGQVSWWNRAASRLLRWPDFAVDVVGHVEWPENIRPEVAELWAELKTGGLPRTREFRAALGARERLLAVSGAVVPSGASAPNFLTLLDDVTDQRELHEEMRHAHRMELRGQVASSIAHDFNNLITLILGYAELLARQVADNVKSIELVRDIQSASARASSLTAQLQSIGRTSAPAPVRLDVGAALSANAEVLERIMGSKNTVSWSLAESTPEVMVDADLFEQMILNLSINARDAMPAGGTLHIASEVRELSDAVGAPALGDGLYVVLRISDTGIGMDEATRVRCFEPLFTTKGPFKGTGLGLASARRLVESSGGSISCESNVGVGTTFTIWLPVPLVELVADPPSDLDADGSSSSAHSREVQMSSPSTSAVVPVTARARIAATILLVEDDAGLRRLALQVLQRNGLVVLEAASAEEALEIRHNLREPLDLLLSDVVLPQMAGTELASILQNEQPDLLVVVMSGTADPEVVDALRPGTATFLAKPFKPSELVDAVINLLSRRGVAAS